MENIPFFRPLVDEREANLINEALFDSNINMINSFEKEIKNYFNSDFGISTNNGTSAMHLALCAMDIKRADKIICSVNSFPNVAEVIRHFDAEPIPVDINEDDFNINIDSFEATLKKNNHKKLKAAFISHVGGQSANMDEIYAIAKEYNIKIIDDASRAMGATYKGAKLGSIKDSFISCFQVNPQIDGFIATSGFFTTNDEEIASRAKLVRNHALISNSSSKDGNLNYIYDVLEIGQKYDLSPLCAAFSRAQFAKTEQFIKRRKEIAAIYNKELSTCPHVTTPTASNEHIYTQYIIKIDKNRDNFARQLKEFGINVALHYIPIHLLTYYKQKYGFKVNDFPTSLRVYQQVLSLPIYADLKDEEVNYICDKVKFVAKNSV
ncbi:DegT/DnrJ/EryC1/StrS family aminotransferase [Campylobacter geochelonis]|uniref:Wbgx protein n=1 Tax=Campylobacter geochelonis TaxID=1780362 RepID=A0A128EGA4_9BACT|nr:DegT/DnrJ/EryC1/StrS family aminotransferase [Campylobacter geochelonis]QKF71071.1 aminotransferase, DegT/DnrJ/EryC1/StrS family [Campylobacter geochelonis]CZE47253.1 wbgx protein [Campylobacter geochelonis]CZE50113.1 wbgx protein [Campylobacter geochelonis]